MSGISSAVPPIKFDSNGNVLANLNAQNITPNANAVNVKTDANGNVLANINAQSITPNANAVNVKNDANGNVLANVNAQNITPNAVATNVKTDANGNVLANLNAQNINPNVANPYAPQLLSHQTGLSYTPSTAGVYGLLGSSVTVPRAGVLKVVIIGHVSGGTGSPNAQITRGTTTYTCVDEGGHVVWNTFTTTSPSFVSRWRYSNTGPSLWVFEIPVLANDVFQLIGTNNTAGDTLYIDDMIVMLL